MSDGIQRPRGRSGTIPFLSDQIMAPLPMPDPHVHGPFTFLLNQNHNALRGCTTCGAAWVGLMAGTPDTLRWHPVAEIEEEEEE